MHSLTASVLQPPWKRLDEWLSHAFPAPEAEDEPRRRRPWVWYFLLMAGLPGSALWHFSDGQDALDPALAEMGRYRPGHADHPAPGDRGAAHRLGVDHSGGGRHRQQPAPGRLAATGGADRRLAAGHRPVSRSCSSWFWGCPGGSNVAAILLMLLGTQWYLLFNIIAGASAIPRNCVIRRICCN